MRLARYCCLIGLTAALLMIGAARGADLMEDVDYRVIPRQRLSDTERIEVVYFFYYGCSWCYQFESFITEWLKRIPHFQIKPGAEPVCIAGKANRVAYLPLSWT